MAIRHSESAGGVDLTTLDALNAGAENFSDVGAGNKAECQNAQRIRRWTEQIAAQPREALANDQNSDNGGKPTEDIGVDPREEFQRPVFGNPHHGENDTDQRPEKRRGDGQDQGVLEADHHHVWQNFCHRLEIKEAAGEGFEPAHLKSIYNSAGHRCSRARPENTAKSLELTSWADIDPAWGCPRTIFRAAVSKCHRPWPRAVPCLAPRGRHRCLS